jgi:PAS domain S-box-containing protein
VIQGREQGIVRPDGLVRWLAVSAAPIPLDDYGVAIAYLDITDRKHMEIVAAHRRRQLQKQQFVMMDLAQRQDLYHEDIPTALRTITETAAQTLQLDQVSIWWCQPGGPDWAMVCQDEFNISQNRHSSGMTFIAANYPTYLESIAHSRILVVDDASHDPRVQDCLETYIQPEDIAALMDVPIRAAGKLTGLLCFEQMGTPRHWELEEQHFAAYLANLVALIYEVSDRRRTEVALRQQERELRTLAENTPDCVMRCDRQFRFTYTNPAITELTQMSSATMLGKTAQELGFPEPLVAIWHQAMAQAFATGQEQRLEYDLALPLGNQTFYSRVVPEVDPEGGVASVLVVARDITDLKRAQTELFYQAEQEHTLRLITQHIRETLDLEVILATVVKEVQRTFQADRALIFKFNSDHSGMVIQEAVRPDLPSTLDKCWADKSFPQECYAAYGQGQGRIVPDVARDSWGACLTEFLRAAGVKSKMVAPILQGQDNGSTRVGGLLIAHACAIPRQWQPEELDLLQQVAEQLAIALYQAELHQQVQAANQELERISNTDSLTQIANRRHFDHRLADECQRAQRAQQPLALLLCDIDYFKQYNDTYGHPAGDACLIASGDRATVWLATAAKSLPLFCPTLTRSVPRLW